MRQSLVVWMLIAVLLERAGFYGLRSVLVVGWIQTADQAAVLEAYGATMTWASIAGPLAGALAVMLLGARTALLAAAVAALFSGAATAWLPFGDAAQGSATVFLGAGSAWRVALYCAWAPRLSRVQLPFALLALYAVINVGAFAGAFVAPTANDGDTLTGSFLVATALVVGGMLIGAWRSAPPSASADDPHTRAGDATASALVLLALGLLSAVAPSRWLVEAEALPAVMQLMTAIVTLTTFVTSVVGLIVLWRRLDDKPAASGPPDREAGRLATAMLVAGGCLVVVHGAGALLAPTTFVWAAVLWDPAQLVLFVAGWSLLFIVAPRGWFPAVVALALIFTHLVDLVRNAIPIAPTRADIALGIVGLALAAGAALLTRRRTA